MAWDNFNFCQLSGGAVEGGFDLHTKFPCLCVQSWLALAVPFFFLLFDGVAGFFLLFVFCCCFEVGSHIAQVGYELAS